MERLQLYYWISIGLIVIACFLSCNILKNKASYQNEPYKYIYTSFPSGDTVFIATMQNSFFNGPIMLKKIKGNHYGGMYDKINEDAFPYRGWTYGNYKQNKKHGEWYFLNKEGVKLISVTYKNDTLYGEYLQLVNSGKDTLLFCNYTHGILDGKFLFNEGNGIINGSPTYGKHRWELNYKKGKLDGLQKKYYEGKLEEEMIFENGEIRKINYSKYVIERQISENGDGFIILERASFAFGILGRQFCKTHNREKCDIFSDDIFSGKIILCKGYFCPDQLKLYSEISKKEKIFNISTIIER